jgi:hypothetical protein
VTDKHHNPYDHAPVKAKFAKSRYSSDSNGACVLVAEWPNGDVWIGDDKDLTRPWLAFRPEAYSAALLSIALGEAPETFPTEDARQMVVAALGSEAVHLGTHSHDPYDHEPTKAEFVKSRYSANSNVLVAEWPNGDVWILDAEDRTRPWLAFHRNERSAVLLSIALGDDPNIRPSEDARQTVLAALDLGRESELVTAR